MSVMEVLNSLSSMSLIWSLHVGAISKSSMATLYVRLLILLRYPTCMFIRAGLGVDVIIIARRSSAALMLLRTLNLRLPMLDMLGSDRVVGLDWFLVIAEAVSGFLGMDTGLTQKSEVDVCLEVDVTIEGDF